MPHGFCLTSDTRGPGPLSDATSAELRAAYDQLVSGGSGGATVAVRSSDTIIVGKDDLALRDRRLGSKERMTVCAELGVADVDTPVSRRGEHALDDAQAVEVASMVRSLEPVLRLARGRQVRLRWRISVSAAVPTGHRLRGGARTLG